MMRQMGWAAVAALLTMATATWGENNVTPLPPAATQAGVGKIEAGAYMFEDEIKPGMKGYGLTVMKGGKIERFRVEVIDVMRNFMPGMNAILVRCADLNLEHSGIIAGMSGSPVFIEDKMIGAIAFGWGASKDPIAGVQPIRQMLDIAVPAVKDPKIQTAGAGGVGGQRWMSQKGLAKEAAELAGWGGLVKVMAQKAGGGKFKEEWSRKNLWAGKDEIAGLRPLSAPVTVSGVSTKGLESLREAFAELGMVPISGGGAGGSLKGEGKLIGGVADVKPGEIKLERGSSIAIPFLSGDIDMSAIGTVTEVANGRVWAFGHAMFADGPTNMPVATGYVYTILPSLIRSFKIGACYQEAGALVTDEQTGIVGTLGAKATMVPMEVAVRSRDGGVNKVYKFEMLPHPRLMPILYQMALIETITAKRNLPKEFTLRIKGEIKMEDGNLKLDSRGTSEYFSLMNTILPLAVLTDNPYQNLRVDGIRLEAEIEGECRQSEIKGVTLEKSVVTPGEELVARVELQAYRGKTRVEEVRVKVPEDAADGQYEFAVGSGNMMLMQEAMYFPQRFDPADVKGLRKAVERILEYTGDGLYGSLVMDVRGASEKGREFKDLPASRVAVYASEKRTDAAPVFATVRTKVATDEVLSNGGQSFMVTVDKNAGKRFYKGNEGPWVGGRPQQGGPGGTTTKGSNRKQKGDGNKEIGE